MYNLISFAAAASTVAAGSGYLALPVKKIAVKGASSNITLNEPVKVTSSPDNLQNEYYQYMASFTLGTPAQSMVASIDTGSSDLWVYSSGASYTYVPSDSSTSTYINNGFEIEYVDGTGANGDYYTDELAWGEATVTVQFAVDSTYSSSSPTGVFGVALPADEASEDGTYPNYPFALKDAGVIEAAAYSLFLNDEDATDGTILFGAIDKSRYTGELSIVPLQSSSDFAVSVSVLGNTFDGILDAGTSLTYLPSEVMDEVADYLGAEWDPEVGAYKAPSDQSKSVTYTFGGVDVVVPPSELYYQLVSGTSQLYLTIFPNSESSYYTLLGDSFLRSAYVVYDLDSLQIGIAQANYGSSSSDYEVIPSGGLSSL